MSAFDFKSLLEHRGHKIEVATYEKDGVIYNVSCECLDCNEVILDYDNPELEEDNEDE